MSAASPHGSLRLASFLALGSAVLLPFADAMAKSLVADYPIAMVAWVRMAVMSLALGTIGGAQLGARLLRPVAWRLQILRGAAAVLGTVMVFLGFRVMPLAECLAIVFIAPVLANLFSRLWLNEAGDAFSWLAAAASFIGVLVIARPGLGVFALDALYPLAGAVGLSAFMTLTRAVSGRDDPRVTAFFGPFIALLVFSTVIWADWQPPKSAAHLAMFVGVGLIGATAQVLSTVAYRIATTHQLAPFNYASLVVSIGVGWMVFQTVPDVWSLLGMAIITAAGVATVLRA